MKCEWAVTFEGSPIVRPFENETDARTWLAEYIEKFCKGNVRAATLVSRKVSEWQEMK